LPPKIRELISQLEKNGFSNPGGKGSHRNFIHNAVNLPITISGKLGDDAKKYQIKAVQRAIAESKNER
jgi:predicted RNA binding protein YcfA (HicA-like mRNA interferase family)